MQKHIAGSLAVGIILYPAILSMQGFSFWKRKTQSKHLWQMLPGVKEHSY